jgi:hypothetical protein
MGEAQEQEAERQKGRKAERQKGRIFHFSFFISHFSF